MATPEQIDAVEAVAAELRAAGIAARRLAPDQLGFVIDDIGGWPLEVGVRIEGPVLRAQAAVCGPGQVSAHELLHDHRKRPFVRFSHAACGTVWVEGELPAERVTAALAGAMLGGVLEAAELGRQRAAAGRPSPG